MAFDGQEKQRRREQFADKHQRLYEGDIEIKTGYPIMLQPAGWTAPMAPDWYRRSLVPPMDDRDIVKMVPPMHRARRGYAVEIDYVRWLQKWDEAEEAFLKKIADYAHGMTKGDARMVDWVNNPPAELMKIAGSGPRRIPRAFIEAAAGGNRWALGLTEKIPAKAEALLAELKPLALRKQHRNIIGFDPLADDETDDELTPAAAKLHDPMADELENLLDLEEQHDPKATGGQKVKPPEKRTREAVET